MIDFNWDTLTLNLQNVQIESLSTIPSRIGEILRDPRGNMTEFLLILAIIIVFIIVVALTVISFITRPKKPVLIETYEIETGEVDDAGNPIYTTEDREVEIPKDRYRKYYVLATLVLMLAIMWVATGITTQNDRVCTSCHINSPHVKELASDPHKDVHCSSCHENYGTLGSLTVSVPGRVAHIVVGTFRTTNVPNYHTFPAESCLNCHKSVTEDSSLDHTTGIRMSHKEPVDAGMLCTDCHVLDSKQKVSSQTTGMQSCLKCHNGKVAEATCESCHTRGTEVTTATEPSKKNAQQLVAPNSNQRCYDCHNPSPCDSCHGVRMPHVAGYAGGGPQHVTDAQRLGYSTCYKCHPAPTGNTVAQPNPQVSPGMADTCGAGCHGFNPDGSIN